MRCTTFPCSSNNVVSGKEISPPDVCGVFSKNQNAGLGQRNEKDFSHLISGLSDSTDTRIASSESPYTSNVGNRTSKIDLVGPREQGLKSLYVAPTSAS